MATTPKPTRTNTAVLFSAAATGAFLVAILVVFIGHQYDYVPLWAFQWTARIWGIVCLVYLSFDLPPIAVAFIAGEREFKVDRYTTGLLVVTMVGLTFWAFSRGASSDAWIMIVENWLVVIIDLIVVFITLKIRAELRKPKK